MRSDQQIICDSAEPELRQPERCRAHLLYVLLLELSLCGAMIQHGDPLVTLGLMAGILLSASVPFIPYRYCSDLFRSILPAFIFVGVCAWGFWRFRNHCYNDLILLECLGISSFALLTESKIRNNFYLLFISLLYLMYGALIPRFCYVVILCIALVLLFLLLYVTRAEHLAENRKIHCSRKNIFLRELSGILFLLLLTAGGVRCIVPLIPLKDSDAKGFFETSFLTKRESALPQTLRSWLHPHRMAPSAKPDLPENENQQPTSMSEKNGTPVEFPGQTGETVLEGNGGGSSGKELLFYADSPVKLYHLVRLYDFYDGKKWTSTAGASRMTVGDTRNLSSYYGDLETKYTVLRLVSPRLPAPFQLYYIVYPEDDFFRCPRVKYTVSGAELENMNVPSVFRYIADSRVIMKKSAAVYGKKDMTWVEPVPKQHFLKLPPKKIISPRVRALAKKLTAGKQEPLEKALALRDYLRNNFRYELHAKPLPAGKEGTDYFLFELKEGHCEYFASALAVLARCAGLPSRVATGFSPGNYNTLTCQFEVYEYHAHAWTQIYFPNLGWLTMDGTPPGSIPSETYPAGIGKLRDPFGDEWKISPPELTEQTQNYFRKELVRKIEQQNGSLTAEQVVCSAYAAGETLREKFRESCESAKKKIYRSQEKGGKLFRMKQVYRKIRDGIIRFLWNLYDLIYTAWWLILPSLLLLILLLKLIRTGLRGFRKSWYRFRLHRMQCQAEQLMKHDPAGAVRLVYRTFRLALNASGFRRDKNAELLAFAEMLHSVNWQLGEDARSVFLAFYRLEYGEHLPAPEEWKHLLTALDRSVLYLHNVTYHKK